jgi:prolyl-tRNA synthetase
MELNETKLTNAISARRVRPATIEEIKAVGAEPGYGSPVGIDRSAALLVVDDLIPSSSNLVAGANREGWHYKNVNYGRDYEADLVLDVVAAAEGHGCPVCGESLRSVRGVEVGNIFKLGTKYSAAMDAVYLDEKGESHPLVMGCYGIGSGRLIASVIENNNDENGIIWPVTIAPYQVHLVSLATPKQPEIVAKVEEVYAALQSAGIEVLYDDRDERAGVKFNDADLVGLPLRLTMGKRGVTNGIVELKNRRTGEGDELALDAVVSGVRAALDGEQALIGMTVVEETMG